MAIYDKYGSGVVGTVQDPPPPPPPPDAWLLDDAVTSVLDTTTRLS
jgi:hypothetical protein